MRIEVLGPIRAQADGTELGLGGSQQRLVLALLAEAGGRVVTTDQLIDRVWGDQLPDNARKTIQVHISKLRRALGNGDAIETIGGGYRLSGEIEIDSQTFEQLLAAGRQHLSDRPEHAGNLLNQALALWSGPAYADLRHEEALQTEIRRLEELRLSAIEDRQQARIAIGEIADAIAELEGLIDEHPVRERLRALLMTALYRAGRQTEALATYRNFSARLAEESGLDPSPELQALELAILSQDPKLGVVTSTPGRPPTSSVLPVRYASFVGREQEIAEIAERMATHRLMTLVGPGGIGKTSLATEALHAREKELDAVIVRVDVESSEKADLALVIATSMGLAPSESAEPESVIIEYAKERKRILFFDGCEPVIDEAARLADSLLTSCPELRIVATSREPLGLAGESVMRVDSLDSEHAFALFCERAGLDSATLDGTATDRITRTCQALDGVPLAIELAAARSRVVPLDELAERIDDQMQLLRKSRSLDSRHGSLISAMEGSYRGLDQRHKQALRFLSVFRHGFEMDAAAASLQDPSAPEIVARLVEVSLVQPLNVERRYRMLEPVRQYAHHLLAAEGEIDTARRLQAEWFARRSARAFADEFTPAFADARDWVFENRYEMRDAAEWSVEAGVPDIAIEVISNAGRQLVNLGYGRLLLRAALAAINHPGASRTGRLAMSMANTAFMLYRSGSNDAAVDLIERAEVLARDSGDLEAIGRALIRKGALLPETLKDPAVRGEDNEEIILEGMSLLKTSGAPDWENEYYNLAVSAVGAGDLVKAAEYAQQHLDFVERITGTSTGAALSLFAQIHLLQGDIGTAIAKGRSAVALMEEHHELYHAQDLWWSLSLMLSYAGDLEAAQQAFDHSAELGDLIGDNPSISLPIAMRLATLRGDHEVVVAMARTWFQRVANADGPPDAQSPSRGLVWGTRGIAPEFLSVLLALVTVWQTTGERAVACRFALAAPALMAESAFERWDEIGETARWQELHQRCPHNEQEMEILSLAQAFAEAAHTLGVDS